MTASCLVAFFPAVVAAFTSSVTPFSSAALHARCTPPAAGIFDSFFGETPEQKAAKDAAYEEQMRVLERRKNPAAYRAGLAATEKRRAAESAKFADKFGWQRGGSDGRGRGLLDEFKKRQQAGKIKKLGYEDVPTGGIQLPTASFGVGGEFGVGGKYDNGERFDLRLPYVETGWVEGEEEDAEPVDFFANLLSGGKLQREADERRKARDSKRGRK